MHNVFPALLQASARLNAIYTGQHQRSVRLRDSHATLEAKMNQCAQLLAAEQYDDALQIILDATIDYANPRYVNQQLNVPVAASPVASLWSAALNQGHAVFDMSPMTSVIEKWCIDWAKSRLGLGEEYFGISTGGGSLGNLTAVLAARNKLDNWHCWENGESRIGVLYGEHSHYSISRACQFAGIGGRHLQAVSCDSAGKMSLASLQHQYQVGRKYLVCLTLGTTALGALDDVAAVLDWLDEADLRDDCWVHVDAAHGASFYSDKKKQPYFAALQRCDSVLWDMHKLFYQSTPLSLLFFRTRQHAGFLSRHHTPYLSQLSDGDYPDMHNWTLECSRTNHTMKLWLSLHIHGEAYFCQQVAQVARMTRLFHDGLAQIDGIVIPCVPETNILCFALKDGQGDVCPELTARLAHDLASHSDWSIGSTTFDGVTYLRICVMNNQVTEQHIDEFCALVKEYVSLGLPVA